MVHIHGVVAGAKFHPCHIREMYDLAVRTIFEHDVAEGKVTVRGRLRVNMDAYFSQFILGPQLSGFLKAYPELKVDLITREALEI